jgi:hypothetical protein
MTPRRPRTIKPTLLVLEERQLLATTHISLAVSNPSMTYGQAEVLTAKVSSPDGTPVGSVTFSDELGTVGTATVEDGVATLATTALPAGIHELTANFIGGVQLSTYTFSTISVPGAVATAAYGVNDSGQIVGAYTNTPYQGGEDYPFEWASDTQGFLDTNGHFQTIDVPKATWTIPLDINDYGEIVGLFLNSTGVHGFADVNGTYTTIDDPKGGGTTVVTGVNNNDQIIGFYGSTELGSSSVGFQDSQAINGVFTALPHAGQAINIHDETVLDNGSDTFIYSGGTDTKVNVPGWQNFDYQPVKGINDYGQIVCLDTIRDANGSYYAIAPTSKASGLSIAATGINNNGQIVGTDLGDGISAVLTTVPSTSKTTTPYVVIINPASLTIGAYDTSVYGTVPVLTASYFGLANNDSGPDVTLITTANQTSHVGEYPITISGAYDTNYNISYQLGTLTITPAQLTIAANNVKVMQGPTMPPFSVTVTGLVNGDTLKTQPTVTTDTISSDPPGEYSLIPAGAAASDDYNIVYVPGTLTITEQVNLIPAKPPQRASSFPKPKKHVHRPSGHHAVPKPIHIVLKPNRPAQQDAKSALRSIRGDGIRTTGRGSSVTRVTRMGT